MRQPDPHNRETRISEQGSGLVDQGVAEIRRLSSQEGIEHIVELVYSTGMSSDSDLDKCLSTPGLVISYIDPGLLKPFVNNSRTHSRRQINQIKASITTFGFTNPILTDPDYNLIAGHGRLIAAKELKLPTVAVIVLDGLTEAQIRLLRIADNKIALNSGWDVDVLRSELIDLGSAIEVDMSVTGFSLPEIEVITSGKPDPADDDIPDIPTSPVCKPGNIWKCGDHVVGCGDSRDHAFVARIVGDAVRVDCAFLDPPWNVSVTRHANVKKRHREFAMASGEMSDAEFQTFLSASLGSAAAVCRAGAVTFVCIDWRHYPSLAAVAAAIYGEQLNLCVWNKSNAGMGSLYRSKYELVGVYRVGDEPHLNNVELGRNGRNRTNVWDYSSVNTFKGSRSSDLTLHPTTKSVAMVADAIRDVTHRGDLVLDTFLGAGATLIASERTGRRFRGLDIDPAYVDVAIQRWVEMTGGKPELVSPEPHL